MLTPFEPSCPAISGTGANSAATTTSAVGRLSMRANAAFLLTCTAAGIETFRDPINVREESGMRRFAFFYGVVVVLCAYAFPGGSFGREPANRRVKMLRPPTGQTAAVTTRPALRGQPISYDLRPMYERTATRFRYALTWKPGDRTGTDEERQFAVHIAQELPDRRGIPDNCRIGAIQTDQNGQWTVDTSRPTVYVSESGIMLNNTYCTQRVHIWAYPGPDGKGAVWRGVRTTYGPTQYPLVWETLSGEGHPAVMYVSKTFEKAAEREYGRPRSGRRFSAERDLGERPDVVVARVLPDGSQPMGPTVYVDAAAKTQTTVMCRCMEPQVSNFVDTLYYDILPLDILGDVQVAAGGPFRLIKSSTPPASDGGPTWIEQALRCPKRF